MYNKSSKYYDIAFKEKKYYYEVQFLDELIKENNPNAKTLLNLACGTGNHEKYLHEKYDIYGLDCNSDFLEIARTKNPSVAYYLGDMTDFELDKKFDVITCLFSSIANLNDINAFRNMLKCCKNHLSNHGIVLIEPFFEPDEWIDDLLIMKTFNADEYKYSILAKSSMENKKGIATEVHTYLDQNGFDTFEEKFVFSLFKRDEIQRSFIKYGLKHEYIQNEVFSRGLHIGYISG